MSCNIIDVKGRREMPAGTPITKAQMGEAAAAVARFKTRKEAAESLGISDRQLRRVMMAANANNIEPKHPNQEHPFAIEHLPQIGSHRGPAGEIKSDKNNIYRLGAFGDLHAASKYCRWDVRADLTKRAEDFGAFCILDAGNWIDGEAPFNRYDLEAVGMDDQLDILAAKYPKTRIPTYAIAGDDHEGWYYRRKGIEVGRHAEAVMRRAGHDWTYLGYMEADILLTNANTGQSSILRITHPKGGSAYSTSYKPQKLIESLEGGDKPAVILIGHHHKLIAGNVRNVWYAMVGTSQDQTPFLRGNHIEAHLGGVLLQLEQDPETGAIISFKPDMIKYYNKSYYIQSGQANNRWSVRGPINQVPRL